MTASELFFLFFSDQHILLELERDGCLSFTPSRQVTENSNSILSSGVAFYAAAAAICQEPAFGAKGTNRIASILKSEELFFPLKQDVLNKIA